MIISQRDEAAYMALGIIRSLHESGDVPAYAREFVERAIKLADAAETPAEASMVTN